MEVAQQNTKQENNIEKSIKFKTKKSKPKFKVMEVIKEENSVEMESDIDVDRKETKDDIEENENSNRPLYVDEEALAVDKEALAQQK